MQNAYNSSVVRIPFDRRQAILQLSAESYYLLDTIYYGVEQASDKSIMDITGYGLSRHRKYKRDLITKGYLLVTQTGRAQYEYTVGGLNE